MNFFIKKIIRVWLRVLTRKLFIVNIFEMSENLISMLEIPSFTPNSALSHHIFVNSIITNIYHTS